MVIITTPMRKMVPGKQVAISPRSLFPSRDFPSNLTNGSLFTNSSSISNSSHQHLKISYHHMASLRRNLEEKYDEVYAPSNSISPGNSGEKFNEEPYRSFSLSEISFHESAGPYLSNIPDKVINSTSNYPFKALAWNQKVPTLGPRTKCLRLGL